MNELLGLGMGAASGFLLHMMRATAFLAVVPLFGQPQGARFMRFVIAVALGAATWWTTGAPTAEFRGIPDLVLFGGREVILGILSGFTVYIVFSAAATAGEFLANEMGLTVSRILDPTSGTQNATLARLVEVLGLLVAFQLDLHHDCMRLLLATHESAPVGSDFEFTSWSDGLRETVSRTLDLAIRIGLPIFALLALSTGALLVLGRALPNVNLLDFGYGLRSMLGLVACFLWLPVGLRVFADGSTEAIVEWIERVRTF